jgi:hypothetical protein
VSTKEATLTLENRYSVGTQLWEDQGVRAHLGLDVEHGEPVTVFLFPRGTRAGSRSIAAFHELARRLTAQSHPSLLEVLSFGVCAQGGYLVTADLEGQSLAKLIDRASPAVSAALAAIPELLAGLGAAHAAGFFHGTVRPERVFWCGDRAVLVGLGLAQLDRALERGAAAVELGDEERIAADYAALGALSSSIVKAAAHRVSRPPLPAALGAAHRAPSRTSISLNPLPHQVRGAWPRPSLPPTPALAPPPVRAPAAAAPRRPAPIRRPRFEEEVTDFGRGAASALAPAPWSASAQLLAISGVTLAMVLLILAS